MTVKLIWITPNAEAIIAKCARVSNPKNQDNPEYAKLLRYCLKNGHVSIFEMASACLEINTSRAIARQILRHRSFNFQEFSQRYSDVKEQPILVQGRSQDLKNRQNSIDDLSDELKTRWDEYQLNTWNNAYFLYQEALHAGIAKEVARSLLPEGLTPSRMYMSGTIRSWIHYLQVRFGHGTQKEHVDVAIEIRDCLMAHLPIIFEAAGLLTQGDQE